MPDTTVSDEPMIRKAPDGTIYPCFSPLEHWRLPVCPCWSAAMLKEEVRLLGPYGARIPKRSDRKVPPLGGILLSLVFVIPWWAVAYVFVKTLDDHGYLWWARSAWWWIKAAWGILWR